MAKRTTSNGQYRFDEDFKNSFQNLNLASQVPTAKEIAEKRLEIETMENKEGALSLKKEDPNYKWSADDEKQMEKLIKELNTARIELTPMESRYFAQGITAIDKEDDPQKQEMTRLQNRINRMEMENKILYQDIALREGQKDERTYAQAEGNKAKINEILKEYRTLENDLSQKEDLSQEEGQVKIQQQKDNTYKVSVVIDGKAYNSTMTEQQHYKMMALDNKQKLNYLATLIPSADIRGLNTSTRDTMLASLNGSLYNLPKPEVYASAQQQIQQTQGASLAAANFEEVENSETRSQTHSMGMGR